MQNRLSSLELHGYKSFANETIFKLPGSVTAIVGPNGSGKSNFADAIRWVLGEQSYSLLRAKKTEDMIFSGSDQRSRAGFASVSITFNNEDNWLPIDYAEVVLTRRAYRDGQNDYLVNNQKVRLKDFHELLARTGLGDRTYTIIGQGLVDVALAIRPDERRKLFEEAAGIGLYRERKEESLKRLDNTKRNLERVLDILSEIKPRLRSLERQATKIIEYRRIQADLNENLKDWYGYHWFKAQQELIEVKSYYVEQEGLVNTIRLKQTENRGMLEEVREIIKAKQEELNHFHTELSKYHSELESSNLRIAILGERGRALSDQINDLEHSRIEANTSIATRKFEIGSLEKESGYQKQDLDELIELQNKANEILNERTKIRENYETQTNSIKSELTKTEVNSINLQARKSELENRIRENEINLQTIDQSLNTLKKTSQALKIEQKLLSNALSEAEDKLGTQHTLIDTLKKEIAIIDKDINDSANLVEDLLKTKTRLQVKLDMITQSEQAMVDMSEGAKSLLKLRRENKTQIEFDAINKAIIVPEKYEKAIVAALGDAIDILRVRTEKINVSLLEQLASDIQGRVAIIGENALPTDKANKSIIGKPRVIGTASQVIDYPQELNSVIIALLGNIWIVEDKQTALNLLNEFPSTNKVVTLDGEIFLNNGIVYLGKGDSSSKLSLPRQKKDIKDQIEKLSTDIERLNIDINNKSITKNNKENVLLANHEQTEILNKSALEQKNNLSKNQIELNNISNQTDWYARQIETNFTKTKEYQSEKQVAEEKLTLYSKLIKELKENIASLQSLISELPLSDFQAQVHKYDTEKATLHEAWKSKESRKRSIIDRLHEQEKQILEIDLRLNESKQRLIEIQDEMKTLRLKIDNYNQSITQIQTDNSGVLERELRNLETEQEKLQLVELSLQKESLIKERQYSQARMDLALKNDKLDNLKEHIEDDFGMVNYEYSQNIVGSNPLPFDDIFIQSLPQKSALPDTLNDSIKELKTQLRKIGAINPEAQKEYEEVKQRFLYLEEQTDDLEKASEDLHKVISELDEIMQGDFLRTFRLVNVEFSQYFTRLFNGGSAKLTISDESDPIASGIDIEAKLPGKREQGLALLSGGERSLAAVALIFALLKVSPTPFCILDEVDAMLDESNVGRFCDLLLELSRSNQFILITHNRNTVQVADVIYGVTMGRDSTSQVLSLRIDQVDQSYLE